MAKTSNERFLARVFKSPDRLREKLILAIAIAPPKSGPRARPQGALSLPVAQKKARSK